MLVDQHAPQAVSGRTALTKAEFHKAALPGKDLHRKLAAVFAGHDALDGLQKVGADAAVVLELLAAVVHPDPGAETDVLMVCALIGVLKSAPATDVVDEDRFEIGLAGFNLGHQLLQRLAAVEPQSRSA